jgi:hypothetical protein
VGLVVCVVYSIAYIQDGLAFFFWERLRYSTIGEGHFFNS